MDDLRDSPSRVTIDDVAKLAGVSIKTVSRVVNGEPNVRPATREKVRRAITHLNYSPNLSARNLASQRSHLVALVYDDPDQYEAPSSGYVVRMQQGALRACRKRRYELLIHPCRSQDTRVGDELRTLIEQVRPDGVLVAAPLSNMVGVVDAIAGTKTPFVRLAPGAEAPGEFAVATDDRESCAEMTRYLASLGHRRIGFISGNPAHRAVTNRLDGYRDGLLQCGIAFDPALVVAGDNSLASGETATDFLLELESPPTALFAANDDMAAGALRVALRRGLKVPADLSIAGFDDSPLACHVFPALTSIRQPLARMAERAAQGLIDAASGQRLPAGTEVVRSSLVIRESTGPAPG
jgi:LacI family transcriptional regulator